MRTLHLKKTNQSENKQDDINTISWWPKIGCLQLWILITKVLYSNQWLENSFKACIQTAFFLQIIFQVIDFYENKQCMYRHYTDRLLIDCPSVTQHHPDDIHRNGSMECAAAAKEKARMAASEERFTPGFIAVFATFACRKHIPEV